MSRNRPCVVNISREQDQDDILGKSTRDQPSHGNATSHTPVREFRFSLRQNSKNSQSRFSSLERAFLVIGEDFVKQGDSTLLDALFFFCDLLIYSVQMKVKRAEFGVEMRK